MCCGVSCWLSLLVVGLHACMHCRAKLKLQALTKLQMLCCQSAVGAQAEGIITSAPLYSKGAE